MAAEPIRRRCRGERGETLIESIISMSVLFIVVMAAFSAVGTAIATSSSHRESARSETLLRSAAEQLQNPDLAYVPRATCPGEGSYVIPPLSTSEPGYTLTVASVTFWGGVSATPLTAVGASFTSTCPTTAAADLGLQRITLSVTNPGGGTDTLTVLKRRT